MGRRARCFSYTRFSSAEQAKGDSLRRQTGLKAEQYAASRGLVLDHSLTLQDLGVSAFKGAHRKPDKALGRFLGAIETGRVQAGDYLLIENLDRLSRENIESAFGLLLQLMGAGIVVVDLSGPQEFQKGGDPYKLYAALGGFIRANEESARKSYLVKESWVGRRKTWGRGAIIPGQRYPFYIRVDPKTRKPSVDRRMGPVARSMVLAYIAGTSLREIVREVNRRRIKPLLTGNKAGWSYSQVSKTLRGLAVRDDPSPITRRERDALRTAFRTRRSPGRPRKDGETSILRGLGRCAACSQALSFVRIPKRLANGKRREYHYLRCSTNSTYPGRCDGPVHIPYEPVAQAVVTLAVQMADAPPPVSKRAAETYRDAAKAAEAALRRAESMAGALESHPSVLGAKRLKGAWERYVEAQEQADTAWNAARPGYGTMDADAIHGAKSDAEMNRALRSFLEYIEIDHRGARGSHRGPDSGTVAFHWRGGGTTRGRYATAAPRRKRR